MCFDRLQQGRFVILEHCQPGGGRADHWDLMFQVGDVLLTLESPAWDASPGPWRVQSLPDHRLSYLDYQGPISGQRGWVRQVDSGRYRVATRQSPAVRLELEGCRFRGELELRCAGGGVRAEIAARLPGPAWLAHWRDALPDRASP